MSVTLNTASANLTGAEVAAWKGIPSSIAVDLVPDRQIDPAIRTQTLGDRPIQLLGTALTVEVYPPDFGAVVYAVDQAREGDVLVIAGAGAMQVALFGGTFGVHLRRIGCAGVIVDGAVRDIDTLGSWVDFPVYARGLTARGPSGRSDGVVNGTVSFGGCKIAAGDLIIGDRDGLISLSPELARSQVADARRKLALEETWADDLKAGKLAVEVLDMI